MRHLKAGSKLGRNPSHRRAMLRNLTTAVLKYEQVETTDAKAKAIRPLVESMITLAKRSDLHARRQVLSYLQEKKVAHKLFEDVRERFQDRQGGYVRIVKKGTRKGDGAGVSIVQLTALKEKGKEERPKGRKAKSEGVAAKGAA